MQPMTYEELEGLRAELNALNEDQHSRINAVTQALRKLINASDDLTGAIECATDQFDPEKGRLMDATSAAEKVLKSSATGAANLQPKKSGFANRRRNGTQ